MMGFDMVGALKESIYQLSKFDLAKRGVTRTWKIVMAKYFKPDLAKFVQRQCAVAAE